MSTATVELLPTTIKELSPEQKSRLEEILKGTTEALTNFEIQRALFDGELNKEAAQAIKRYLGELRADNRVTPEGNKRGRRYKWNS